MDMQACTEALRAKVGDSSGLNATLKFDCGADGVAYIDGKSVPNSVHNDNREADCTLEITLENLEFRGMRAADGEGVIVGMRGEYQNGLVGVIFEALGGRGLGN